jgi:hypothetical protein
MSPIDIRSARSKFIRAFVAALAVAALVAGSAFALTKHPATPKAEPWIADSAKQRAQLDAALASMESESALAPLRYVPLKVTKWHRPKPRVVVLPPRIVLVSHPVKTVTQTAKSGGSGSSKHSDDGASDDHGTDDRGTSGGTGGDN